MKMPYSSWCEIKNKEQWELFKSLHRDARFYGMSQESIDRDIGKGDVTTAHCMSDGEIAYRNGGIDRNGDLTHLSKYKLPDCGPIPEGWQLVDKEKDAFTKKARYWSKYSNCWRLTSESWEYSEDLYIIPIETKASEGAKLPNDSYVVINDESDFELFRKTYPGDTHLYHKDPIDSQKNTVVTRRQIYKNSSGMLGTVMGANWGAQVHLPKKTEPKQFPKGHYFLNTPENIAAFKKEFPEVLSVSGSKIDDMLKAKPQAFGYGYTFDKRQRDRGFNCLTHGDTKSYTEGNYQRYYFPHEKQEVTVKEDVFPDKHYFKNTPENIDEFLRRFKNVKSNLGYNVDRDWFNDKKDRPEFGMQKGNLGHVSSSGRGWHADNGYQLFVFEHEKASVAAAEPKPSCQSQSYSAQQDKPAWVDKFVSGTFIKVTKDNADEVAKHLAGMKWCNKKPLLEDLPHSWPECNLFNTAGMLTYSNHGYSSGIHKTEVFVGEQPKHKYSVGDKIVVTQKQKNGYNENAFWTKYEVGTVAIVKSVMGNGELIAATATDMANNHSQILKEAQVRPATDEDLPAAMASKVVESKETVEKKYDLSFSDVVKKVNPEFYKGSMTFTAEPGLGKTGCTYGGSSKPIGVTMHATESIPAGTLVSFVPTSTSEKEEKMLTQSERDDVIRIAVEAATAASKAKSGPGVASKATGLATTAVKGLAGWALAPAKPVGRLAIKLLQYGVFLVGVVGGGSYLAYWTYNNGKDYLPTIEFKKPEDKSPKDSVMNSVTHFATTGEITG